jgi:phage shock protein A
MDNEREAMLDTDETLVDNAMTALEIKHLEMTVNKLKTENNSLRDIDEKLRRELREAREQGNTLALENHRLMMVARNMAEATKALSISVAVGLDNDEDADDGEDY